MEPLVVAAPGERARAEEIAQRIGAGMASSTIRSFPDGEAYVRIDSPVEGRDVVVVASMDRPDSKFMTLFFIAETARELGARRIGLVSPYLPYLRQDVRFESGEAVTSRYFANLVSRSFDWLVTVEPHLHRLDSLSEIYAISTEVVRVAAPIAEWIRQSVDNPVLVGPDEESRQWVSAVAKYDDAPTIVLEKVRHGDYDVQVEDCNETVFSGGQPVLIDDIISTGRTMIEAAARLEQMGMKAPVCIGIHGLFATDALVALQDAGIERIVTCSTVEHETNAIDVTDELADGVRRVIEPDAPVAVASGSGAG